MSKVLEGCQHNRGQAVSHTIIRHIVWPIIKNIKAVYMQKSGTSSTRTNNTDKTKQSNPCKFKCLHLYCHWQEKKYKLVQSQSMIKISHLNFISEVKILIAELF